MTTLSRVPLGAAPPSAWSMFRGVDYKTNADSKHGVERIQMDAADKLKFEDYQDAKSEYH